MSQLAISIVIASEGIAESNENRGTPVEIPGKRTGL